MEDAKIFCSNFPPSTEFSILKYKDAGKWASGEEIVYESPLIAQARKLQREVDERKRINHDQEVAKNIIWYNALSKEHMMFEFSNGMQVIIHIYDGKFTYSGSKKSHAKTQLVVTDNDTSYTNSNFLEEFTMSNGRIQKKKLTEYLSNRGINNLEIEKFLLSVPGIIQLRDSFKGRDLGKD